VLVICVGLWWVYKGGGMKKEQGRKCKDYEEKQKADVAFT
jgi:hypothetical protein